jgi:hydrogenase maturation factor HypF (carbamoyltransferase family)
MGSMAGYLILRQGCLIEAEAEEGQVQHFIKRLVDDPPPLALIRSCEVKEIDPVVLRIFT